MSTTSAGTSTGRAGRDVIPPDVITKPPSAELRPDQRDDQSLPPYDVLDPILELYVEDDRTAAEIIELGHDEAIVRRVTRLVDIAEYKRRQCPPGVRVSAKAFGKDRRLPITNGYRGPERLARPSPSRRLSIASKSVNMKPWIANRVARRCSTARSTRRRRPNWRPC